MCGRAFRAREKGDFSIGKTNRQLLRRRGITPAIPTFVRRPKHGRPIHTGPSYSPR
jgi:hypothetical protein